MRGGLLQLGILVAMPSLFACVDVHGSGLDAQRIVARKSVELLPKALSPLFQNRIADLQERTVEPDTAWKHDKNKRGRALWHRVAMDVAAKEQTRDARMAAALNFPNRRSAAKRLYGKQSIRGGNGTLLWVVEDQYKELVDGFAAGTQDEIIRLTGALIHFATDAAFPFAATANYDGKLTGNLHLGRLRMGHPHYAHRDVAARFSAELIRRNRSRYAELITIDLSEYDPVNEPIIRTRAVLMAALADLDIVTSADADVVELMQITGGDQLLDRADEYYSLMDERCSDVCAARLNHAVVLAANLVGGAWSAAGEPSLEEIQERGLVPDEEEQAELVASEKPEATEQAPKKGLYVGSRNSNVFHQPHCKFAEQISPDNLVHFESMKSAKDGGRRGCRFCRP